MRNFLKKHSSAATIIGLLVLIVTVFASAQVIYDLYGSLTWTKMVPPETQTAADTSYAFDVSPYVGKIVLAQTITGATGTTITYTSKIQHSADSTTWTSAPTDSAFTDFTSSADALTGNVQYKSYDTRKVKRYLRHISTLSASDTIQVGVLAIGQKRVR